MKHVALVLIVALIVTSMPVAAAQQNTASIAGIARDAQRHVLPNVKVQLRNVDTGALVGSTQSGADGTFQFSNLPPGNYVVEVVDNDGKIIGVTSSIAVAAGAVITGVAVGATAAGAVAAAAAAGGIGAFFGSTAGLIVVGAAAAAGVAAGVAAAGGGASPSR